jgi:hypothetical protein
LPRINHIEGCHANPDRGLAILATCLLIGFVIAAAFTIVFCFTANKRRFIYMPYHTTGHYHSLEFNWESTLCAMAQRININ